MSKAMLVFRHITIVNWPYSWHIALTSVAESHSIIYFSFYKEIVLIAHLLLREIDICLWTYSCV